jgi:hypothetical protein
VKPLNALELKILIKNLREVNDPAKEEMKHQRKMKSEISKLSATKKKKDLDEEDEEPADDSGDEGGDESAGEGGDEGGDESGEKEAAPADQKKSDKLPGARKLAAASKSPKEEIKSDDVISRLNFIRAGKSLKDEEVSKQLKSYIDGMSPEEKKAFFAFSDGIAKIVLGGQKAAEVPNPLDTYSIKLSAPKGEETPQKVTAGITNEPAKQKPTVGSAPPIVVGEGVKTRMKEVDVPVRSGKLVPFGSRSHIADIESRIEDIERIRSYQEQGSETRQAFTIALKALKNQLKAAYRSSTSVSNPRVSGVPPLVEKD